MNTSRRIAFVIASLVSTAVAAGAQAPTRATPNKADRRHGAMAGLQLSASEKTRIKGIHTKYKVQTQALRTSLEPSMQQARVARKKGDAAEVNAIIDRTKGDREKLRALKLSERSDVRSALTPEHQRAFDAKVQQASAKHGKKGTGARGAERRRTNG